MSDMELNDCIIKDNSAAEGGGIHCSSSSNLTVRNSSLSGNTADYGGGVYSDYPDQRFTYCNITGNTASVCGGGIYCDNNSPFMLNCTIAGNTASVYGGGLYCLEDSSPTITNCILWHDSPEEVYVRYGDPVVTYSDLQGGWEGEGNIDSDPLFADPGSGDYSLLVSSPCIDSGDPYSRLDLNGSINDMGSYGGSGDLPEGVLGLFADPGFLT